MLVTQSKWDAVFDQHKAMIVAACGDTLSWSLARSEALQFEAMLELEMKGVTIHRRPDAMLAAFRDKWREVVEEESAKDSLFRRINESFTAFQGEYAIWKEHGYLE
ncbi:MAG: hypothetical protein V3V17_06940 [Alphaproteobacteria bacterium]